MQRNLQLFYVLVSLREHQGIWSTSDVVVSRAAWSTWYPQWVKNLQNFQD